VYFYQNYDKIHGSATGQKIAGYSSLVTYNIPFVNELKPFVKNIVYRGRKPNLNFYMGLVPGEPYGVYSTVEGYEGQNHHNIDMYDPRFPIGRG
jgi:hypothetical protein